MKTQTNNHPLKKYPVIGACGLDCGLCPRFHSGGEKPCPGCCGEGFWDRHPSCPFITCAVNQRGLESCGECNELEFCPKVLKNLEGAKRRDSFLSYKTLSGNLENTRRHGHKQVADKLKERIDFLRLLIGDYNDGRSKAFYCLSVQLLPLDKMRATLSRVRELITPDTAKNDIAKMVREGFLSLAGELGVDLKLRTGKTD